MTTLVAVVVGLVPLQKEELLKLAVLPRLLQLMEGQAADAEAAYAAAGCLACLVQHPKWLAEVSATGALTNKVRVRLLPRTSNRNSCKCTRLRVNAAKGQRRRQQQVHTQLKGSR